MKQLLFAVSAIAILTASCKKDETTTPEPTPKLFSASMTLDNTIDFETGDVTYHATVTNAHDSTEIDSVRIDYFAFFDNAFITDNGQNIGRLMIGLSGFRYKTSEYTNGALPFNESILGVGTTYFAEGSEAAGPEVVFLDMNGTEWSTRYGSQSGSTFTISQNVQGKTSDRRYLKGTFACKVYNKFDPAQFRVITNGKFDVFLPKAEL